METISLTQFVVYQLACHSRFTRFSTLVRRATQRAHLRIRNANRMNDDQITFAEICPLFRFPRAAAAIQQSESDCKMGSKPFEIAIKLQPFLETLSKRSISSFPQILFYHHSSCLHFLFIDVCVRWHAARVQKSCESAVASQLANNKLCQRNGFHIGNF